jgi:hypothetical protein
MPAAEDNDPFHALIKGGRSGDFFHQEWWKGPFQRSQQGIGDCPIAEQSHEDHAHGHQNLAAFLPFREPKEKEPADHEDQAQWQWIE